MSYPQLKDTRPVEFGRKFISFITGEHNEQRIALKYYFNEDTKAAYALVRFGQLAQGPPGHAHGGAISAVFDELMGACCWLNGYPAMTAQYTTRFFKPVSLELAVLYCAEVKVVEGAKINLEAELIDETGEKYAEARGLFILQDLKTFENMNLKDSGFVKHLSELGKQKLKRGKG